MINIVIPMAGKGQRFVDKGYNQPKPFIDVFGKPMISQVINNLSLNDESKLIFIQRSDFAQTNKQRFHQQVKCFNHQIIYVDRITEGAACSVLLAKQFINNKNQLIVANCDQIILDNNYMQKSIQHYRNTKSDGGILCFKAQQTKWSYARVEQNYVVQVAQKKVISNLATVGIYYFKEGQQFVKSSLSMIQKDIRVNGQFYVCPVYNQMISNKKNISIYQINKMHGIGTPQDLQKFIKNETI